MTISDPSIDRGIYILRKIQFITGNWEEAVLRQVLNHGGRIKVLDVPSPSIKPNHVLVRNRFSVISTGTERAFFGKGSRTSTIASMILDDPSIMIRRTTAGRESIKRDIKRIIGKSQGIPMGYSSSGIVIEVGENVRNLSPGDRVACMGGGYAVHAEIICVPESLACRIPPNVEFAEAAFGTIGATALQGVRRSGIGVGETAVVLGVGLVGLMAAQILKTAGAKVIGIDQRHELKDLARMLGVDTYLMTSDNVVPKVLELSGGLGADSVIICASSPDSAPINQAMDMVRKKGKVVVLGDVGLDLKRQSLYMKELDLLASCSAGPGRYDPSYEEGITDYPASYVRWTEGRNLESFLHLVSEGRVVVKPLISQVFSLEQAAEAYDHLKRSGIISIIFEYPHRTEQLVRKVSLRSHPDSSGVVQVGIIGAGEFVQSQHLPNLKSMSEFHIRAISTRTGHKVMSLASEYGADYCSTDYRDILDDDGIDMVLIGTRHDSHAEIAIQSAEHGKDIFLEKPLALNFEDSLRVLRAVEEHGVSMTIGFNRRFAPIARQAKSIVDQMARPIMLVYKVNASSLTSDHWLNDPLEGGGPIMGECCHFFDFLKWIVDSDPVQIFAQSVSSNDPEILKDNNFLSTIRFQDGSVATLLYTSMGSKTIPKERIEIFGGNSVLLLDDFTTLSEAAANVQTTRLKRGDKGHRAILKAFGDALRGDIDPELPSVNDAVAVTAISLKVLESLRTGEPQDWDIEIK